MNYFLSISLVRNSQRILHQVKPRFGWSVSQNTIFYEDYTHTYTMSYHEIIVGVDLLVDARLRVVMVSVEDGWAIEVVEDVYQTSSVPVIGHSAAVVDVASRVDQHL